MRKEVFTAVIVGLLVAFIVTAAVNRASLIFRPKPATNPLATATPNPTGESPAGSEVLTLHSPEDGLVQSEDTLVVSGTTEPNRPVVLLVNQIEEISSSDEDGNFSFTVSLKDGGNVLELFVLRDDGTNLSAKRVVIVGDYIDTATASATTNN